MCKSEIFAKIIGTVADETEISTERILSNNKDSETVDARYLLVHLLIENGFYPSWIAGKLHKTKRSINYIVTNFDSRIKCGKMLRIYLERLRKRLFSAADVPI